jgi:hypothetical protein
MDLSPMDVAIHSISGSMERMESRSNQKKKLHMYPLTHKVVPGQHWVLAQQFKIISNTKTKNATLYKAANVLSVEGEKQSN